MQFGHITCRNEYLTSFKKKENEKYVPHYVCLPGMYFNCLKYLYHGYEPNTSRLYVFTDRSMIRVSIQ